MIDQKLLAQQLAQQFTQLAGAISSSQDALRRAVMEFGRGGSVPVDPIHRDVNAGEPAKIVDKGARRSRIIIRALKGNANTIEIGNTRQLVYGRGIPLEPGETYTEEIAAFKGEWWAIAATGAANGANGVRAIEQLFAEGD